MNINIITLFPKMFSGPFDESLILHAQKKGLINLRIHNLRDWARGKHKQVDDSPYGGGAGMVLKVDVLDRALSTLKSQILNPKPQTISKSKIQKPKELQPKSYKLKPKIILLTPQGKTFNQKTAKRLSKYDHLILICGHYEGFDERVRNLVDEEISIGDYILTGGELPAMVIADAIVRLLPEVVGKNESIKNESFANNLLDFPVYTRPENYKGSKVPKILLSGDHRKIAGWREKEAQKRTQKRRPDLLK